MAERRAPADVQMLEERLGYAFRDRSLLEAALSRTPRRCPPVPVRAGESSSSSATRCSTSPSPSSCCDACPEFDEGELSKRRASLVRTRRWRQRRARSGLGEAIRLGRGEERSGGRAKDSILAAAYEPCSARCFATPGSARAGRRWRATFADEIGPAAGDRGTGLEDAATGADAGATAQSCPNIAWQRREGRRTRASLLSRCGWPGVACGAGERARASRRQSSRRARGRTS